MNLKVKKLKEDNKDMIEIELEVNESQEEQDYIKNILIDILGGEEDE